ncbi:MAG TPA: nuclease A inhibitor family protein [Pyrinomonadaceae bacterium]|jgi:hypothetical protein
MKSDEQILEEIGEAARGLFRMSEGDYAVEPFGLGAGQAPDHATLRRAAGAADDAGVTADAPETFFRPAAFIESSGGGAFGPAPAARVEGLSRALLGNLSEVKVYRVGEVNIAVYVLGRSAGGNWLGVSTRVVET